MKFDGMVAFLQKLHNKIPADNIFSTDIIDKQFNDITGQAGQGGVCKRVFVHNPIQFS